MFGAKNFNYFLNYQVTDFNMTSSGSSKNFHYNSAYNGRVSPGLELMRFGMCMSKNRHPLIVTKTKYLIT